MPVNDKYRQKIQRPASTKNLVQYYRESDWHTKSQSPQDSVNSDEAINAQKRIQQKMKVLGQKYGDGK